MSISEVKTRLPELVSGAEDRDDEIIVTRNGKPAAVLVNYPEYGEEKDSRPLFDPPANTSPVGFFASVVIHEGEKTARMVTDFLGNGVLMYSSDYPHAESRFPESTDKVLAWKSLGDEVMRKMLWGNATRCLGEP